MKPKSLGSSGMSLTQTLIGMGVGSVAMLAGMQFLEISVKSNRGVQLSGEFNALSATTQQLILNPNVCANVLSGQTFTDQNPEQSVVLKNPAGGTPAADFISTAHNPYAPGLKVTSITLKKLSGASNKYFTQLDLKAQKQGQTIGGKELTTTMYLNIETDAADKIVACSGGGDYVRRTGDTMAGPLIVPEPTASSHPATKSYVDNRVDAAGGGSGAGCYESPSACRGSYQNMGTVRRYTCTWGADPGIAAIGNSLSPCPNAGYNTSYPGRTAVLHSAYIDLNICCK